MAKPFTTDDLYLHQKVTAVHGIDGHHLVVCEVRGIDRDADDYVTNLWEFATDGSGGRQITFSGSDSSPRLAPSGDQLAFISSRARAKQLYCLPRGGGEARQVSSFESGISSFRWMPNACEGVASAAVAVAEPRTGPWAALPAPSADLQVESGWRLPYKEDGIGNVLKRNIHLFRIDAGTGQTGQLTHGAFDVMGFDVSPDGGSVAYARTRDGRFAHSYDLWLVDLQRGEHRRLTTDHAMVMQPVWSPDGRRIAFTGAVDEGDAEPRLWVVDVASSEVTEVCPGEIDVADPESLHWTDDGQAIVFLRAFRGRHQVARVVPLLHELEVLDAQDRQLGQLVRAGGGLVYVVEHPSLPSEVWSLGNDGGEVKLSRLNPWWDDRVPIRASSRDFTVSDGRGGVETVQGWLLQGCDGTSPTPLLDDVHGGPASYALLDFDTNVFWQVLCSQGWSVLALNAVGSSSFGREFCQRLAGHWGELDLPQHLAAIEALQAEGLCDDRVAISGKSYGGYFSCWAIGHTELFKAAIVMAPVGNIETHYGTSDGGYYADPYYIATKPAFDRELARKLSPLQYVEKAATPTLFMQGKDDERCPKCQSEELFVSLYRAGETPTQLVLYPGETHAFLGEGTPACRRDAANRIVAWASYYAAPATDANADDEAEDTLVEASWLTTV